MTGLALGGWSCPKCRLLPLAPLSFYMSQAHSMGAQLKFWVNQANTAAGRKVLTKSGRVDDLWQHLAAHYGLDLTVVLQ